MWMRCRWLSLSKMIAEDVVEVVVDVEVDGSRENVTDPAADCAKLSGELRMNVNTK